MQKSESIGELAKALAVAQGEIQNAKKDSENPFFRSKYADLAAVREACQGPLSKNGLAVIQTPKTTLTEDHTIISVETLLCHSSGEWISEELSAIPVKTDPQGIGSCITYLRRYALSAVAGVASEDDDGNAASQNGSGQQTATARQPKLSQKATEIKQLKQAAVDACRMLKEMGDDSLSSSKRLDAFCVQEFGLPADSLELEPLRELVKRLSLRMDDLRKKGPEPSPDEADRLDKERKAKLESIMKNNTEKAIDEGMKNLKFSGFVTNLSLDQLVELDEWLSLPF
jgi:hypothetical protein